MFDLYSTIILHFQFNLNAPATAPAQEWNAASRFECQHHPHPPACVFENIGQFFLPPVCAMIPQLRNGAQFKTKLWPLVQAGKAVKTNLVKNTA